MNSRFRIRLLLMAQTTVYLIRCFFCIFVVFIPLADHARLCDKWESTLHSSILIIESYMKSIKKCEIVYNVPYSPEYNPVERVFSKTKNLLRKEMLTKDNLLDKIEEVFTKVTPSDLTNFFIESLSKLNH